MLSKPLTSWLLDEHSDAVAVKTIASSPMLRSEAVMALPALRIAAMAPATHSEIKGIIGSRFATYPQPQRDEGEAAAFWADYFDALAGCTPAAIEAGMTAHVRDPASEFLPKPGRLAALAKATPNTGRWAKAYSRAKAATAPAPVVKEMTEEDRMVIRRQVSDLVADLEAKAQAHTERSRSKARLRPTPSARVDDRGVSDEMRRLLISQGTRIAPPAADYEHAFTQDRAA